jgi:hypothetical protein
MVSSRCRALGDKRKKTISSVVRFDVLVLSAILIGLWSRPALAYVDPGSGSAAYQIVLSAILAVAYAIRRFASQPTVLKILGRLRHPFLGSHTPPPPQVPTGTDPLP